VKRSRKIPLAVLLLFLAATLPAMAGIQEIEGFYRVSEEVATGGQPSGPQIAELGKAGFRTVMSLRQSSEYDEAAEAEESRRAGMRFVSVPIEKPVPAVSAVEEFLKVTDDPGIYPVFIHCGSGNRVGALWMVRRVLRDGWSVEAAENEADRIGLTSEALRKFALEYIRDHEMKAAAGTAGCSGAAGGR
jgi:uncharacterized protein (TIGR01244 family)